jgi:hypothetical protein
VIGLGELAGLDVVHGPRRLSPVIYDAWLAVLRKVNPRFEFTDPPFRWSLPIPLAVAAALVWSGDLPRLLQQVLFDAADSVAF